MKKIYRKDVEAEIRANAKRKEVSAGSHYIDGKKSLNTAMRNLTLTESIELLQREFAIAADKFGVNVEEVRFGKPNVGGEHSILKAVRLETDEEMENRIQRETDRKVDELRTAIQRKRNEKYRKQRKIEELKKELEKLQA